MNISSKKPLFLLTITLLAPFFIKLEGMGSTQDIIADQQEFLRKKKKKPIKNRYTINNRVSFNRGENSKFTNLTTSFYYRFSKKFTALIITPFRLENMIFTNTTHSQSQGIGDIILEGTYYFYRQQKKNAFYRGSLIGGVKLPTGNSEKRPILGTGSTDIISLLSLSRASQNSYAYASLGGFFPSFHKMKKRGNTIFNTFIFGMVSQSASAKKLKYMLLMQLDSAVIGRRTEIITQQNPLFAEDITKKRMKIADTKASIVYLGPSVYVLKDNLTLQWQVQVPIYQKRFNINMRGSFTFTWTF